MVRLVISRHSAFVPGTLPIPSLNKSRRPPISAEGFVACQTAFICPATCYLCLELLAESPKCAAANGIFVALSAGQTRLLREYGSRGSISRQDDQRCGCH